MKSGLPKTLVSLAASLQKPIESPAIAEWDFFNPSLDLWEDEWDPCLDYELARESASVQQAVNAISGRSSFIQCKFTNEPDDQAARLKAKKFAPVFCNQLALLLIQRRRGLRRRLWQDEPPVPLVAAVCPWFPEPWLSRGRIERRRVLRWVSSMYRPLPLLVIDFPNDPAELRFLLRAIQEDVGRSSKRTMHLFHIDRDKPRTKLVEAFGAWLSLQSDITAKDSEKGKKRRSKLTDLACFRLMRVGTLERDELLAKGSGLPKHSGAVSKAAARARKMLDSRLG